MASHTGGKANINFSTLKEFIIHQTTKTQSRLSIVRVNDNPLAKVGKYYLNVDDEWKQVRDKQFYFTKDALAELIKVAPQALKFLESLTTGVLI